MKCLVFVFAHKDSTGYKQLHQVNSEKLHLLHDFLL